MDLPIIISKLFISINVRKTLPITRIALLPKTGTGNNITFHADSDLQCRDHRFFYIVTMRRFHT